MYAIIVYDVNVKRVNKLCQYLRQYLNWVQNSVFEGELTISELKRIEEGIKRIINEEEDSVIIYIFQNQEYVRKFHIGKRKYDFSTII